LSCTIGKNNTPLTSVAYSASNLPEGLNIAKDTGIISGVPTTPTNSAMTSTIIATYINDDERLFGSTTITFNISNTLIISATRLLADENLRNNCNLQINDGALNKVSE
jgi:hypothetical protein